MAWPLLPPDSATAHTPVDGHAPLARLPLFRPFSQHFAPRPPRLRVSARGESMRVRATFATLVPLALLPVLAAADDPVSLPYTWAKGATLEAEVKTTNRYEERGPGGAEGGDTTLSLSAHFVYLDRVEELRDGRVVKLTRHFKTARVQEGAESKTDLEGRVVTITREGDGVRATWSNGRPVRGFALELVQASLWPDTAREWKAEQGARQGDLTGAGPDEVPAGVPSFVSQAVGDFGISVEKGSWTLRTTGELKPFGRLELEVTLSGSIRDDSSEEVTVTRYTQQRTATLALRECKDTTWPAPLPPPADRADPEYEGEDEGVPEPDEPPAPEGD